jgi:sulfide dehydrogenase cytochrome subunit
VPRLKPEVVIPVKARIHPSATVQVDKWIGVFGGMTIALQAIISCPAAAAAAPAGASSCSGCHAASAAVQTPVPRLAGRAAPDIMAAMQAFRSGQRPATVMGRIAKGFSEAEIAAIAEWYAAQKD